MANIRPLKIGTNGLSEFADVDTIPANLIGIVPKFEVPSGSVNGSNTAFTLSTTPISAASVCMFLDGISQQNGTDYTVSGTTVTFAFAPASGTLIWAVYNNAATASGGDFSSNTSTSVDGEIVLFSGTAGKTGKRATGTGLVKITSGVLAALTAAQSTAELNDFVGDSGSGGTKGLVPAPASGDAAASKFLKADGTWSAAGGAPAVISPSQITADQDNYNPTGWSTCTIARISSNDIRAITSFSARSDGTEIMLINVGSYPVYLPGEHPDGTAANRITTGYDHFIHPQKSAKIIYDGTTSRWIITTPKESQFRGLQYGTAMGSTTAGDWGTFAWATAGTAAAVTANAATSSALGNFQCQTGTTSSGAAVAYFTKTIVTPFYFSLGHINAFAIISFPILSDGTNTYQIAALITASPSSTNQNPNNSVGIRYDSSVNSGKWQGFSRDNAGTESTVDLGITAAVNTHYLLRVEIDKSKTEARFYIDGIMLGRVTGNMPNSVASGSRLSIIKSAGTTSRVVNVHAFYSETIIG